MDEDIEIDIDEVKENSGPIENGIFIENNCVKLEENVTQDLPDNEAEKPEQMIENVDTTSEITKDVDENLLSILKSNDFPTKECILEENEISDAEKFIHSEFFEGKSVKTPGRYLKV